ncbi:MAG: phosphatase PAP2 family protein [Planctomycetes bacterium]|nr:phosphatase PAP2 family protein [Planctomycetota bacterium]
MNPPRLPPLRPHAWLIGLIALLLACVLCLLGDRALVAVVAVPPGSFAYRLIELLSSRVLGGLAFAAAFGLLWRLGRRPEAWTLSAATAATLGASFALKLVVNRARPAAAALVGKEDASFPSNHAAGAVAIALVASQVWPRYRPSFLAAATLYAATRVLLGVHYASDVLGGAAVATAAVFAVLLAVQARARPQPAPPPPANPPGHAE